MLKGLLGDLVENLKRLPGVGTKSAERIAMYLISDNKKVALQLSESIKLCIENYKNCTICNMLTDEDPCRFCTSSSRNDKVLCIVENTQDVYLIEDTHEFKGKFFVLGKLLSPLDGIGPDQIKFPQLKALIDTGDIEEVILALNPSAEGESTMNFLGTQLGKQVSKITRLSTGLPFGGDIEYTSSLTLSNALKRRYSINDE
ncbi:recombination mediator RecR [Candidatus Cloacimonadota bacterium]